MARNAPFWPVTATGDGTTKTFALGFTIILQEHVRVIKNGVLMVLGTDYAVVEATSRAPSIRFFAAPANGHAIKFYRNTSLATPTLNPEISHVEARTAHLRSQELADQRVVLGGSVGGDFGQTALLAPTALSFVAPMDGYLESLDTLITKAITTGGTLTVAIDGVAVTGMVATIANAAAVGANQRVLPTVGQSTTTKVRRGQTITVTPASFATAGDVRVSLELQPADLT